jgi:hypothetical protein
LAIYFVCPCGKDLRAEESKAGGQIECPNCRRRLVVPSLQVANPALGITAFPIFQTAAEQKTKDDKSSPASKTGDGRFSKGSPPPQAKPSTEQGDSLQSEDRWWNDADLQGTHQADDDRPYPVAPSKPTGENRALRKAAKKEMRRLFTEAQREEAERQKVSFPWPRETHWWQCLLYPVRAWRLLLGLSVAWSLVTVLFLGYLPENIEAHGVKTVVPASILALPLFGYTWAFFRCVLISACRGEAGFVSTPGRDTIWAAGSTVIGLFCSLAGPLVPIVVGVIFWLNSGDLVLVDWLILWELATLAVAHWVLALAACQVGGRPWDAGPAGIARLVGRLGLKKSVGVFVAASPAAGCALLGLSMLENPATRTWVLVPLYWVGGLSGLIFLLRWLGLACFGLPKKPHSGLRGVEVVGGWGGSGPIPG